MLFLLSVLVWLKVWLKHVSIWIWENHPMNPIFTAIYNRIVKLPIYKSIVKFMTSIR